MQPRLLPYFPASGLLPRLKHIDEATGQILMYLLAGSFPRRTSNNSPLAFFMKQATADDGLK